MALTLVSAISLGIWLYLVFGRGGFWRVGLHIPPLKNQVQEPARIVAVVPARDEAPVVGEAVRSLLNSGFPFRCKWCWWTTEVQTEPRRLRRKQQRRSAQQIA